MPIYSFRCRVCDTSLDAVLPVNEVVEYAKTWLYRCDDCDLPLVRKYHPPAVHDHTIKSPFWHPAFGRMITSDADLRQAHDDYEAKWGHRIVQADKDHFATAEEYEAAEESTAKTFEAQAKANHKSVEDVKSEHRIRKVKLEESIG